MSRLFVDDDLWTKVEPMLPRWKPNRRGGQPRKPDRLCLSGIMFVLKTGIPWEDFPQEMGCCGMTLWNRLHEWRQTGAWPKIHRVLKERLGEARPYRPVPRQAAQRHRSDAWMENNTETDRPPIDQSKSQTQARRAGSLERRNPSPDRLTTAPFIRGGLAEQRKRVG